jgi:hypothetical protein
MKNALILFGNLRTFLMPIRGNEKNRVCDIFIKNIINNNNFDIFISTDANDYYFDNNQIFYSKNIDIVNGNNFRLLDNIKILDKNESKNIVNNELYKLFNNKIKDINIEIEYNDYSNNNKVKLLEESNCSGASPRMIVAQYKSLYDCYQMLTKYEEKNSFKYENIMKCRFDFLFNDQVLNINNLNKNIDLYVPGIRKPIIYDFFAYGKRNCMIDYISMYEKLGFMLPNKTFMIECRKDGNVVDYGENPTNYKCNTCNLNNTSKYDITISSEHHLYKMLEDNKYTYTTSNINGYVYRYRDSDINKDIKEIIKSNIKENINIYNHSPGNKSEKNII